jgi:hypothetical protein
MAAELLRVKYGEDRIASEASRRVYAGDPPEDAMMSRSFRLSAEHVLEVANKFKGLR